MIKRIFKYGLVGLSGVAVAMAIITLCVEVFKMNPRTAWYVAAFFTILNNFILNNYYTWSERKVKKQKEIVKKIVLYYIFMTLTVALNYFVYNILLNRGFHYLISITLTILICASLNFLVNELVVWSE